MTTVEIPSLPSTLRELRSSSLHPIPQSIVDFPTSFIRMSLKGVRQLKELVIRYSVSQYRRVPSCASASPYVPTECRVWWEHRLYCI